MSARGSERREIPRAGGVRARRGLGLWKALVRTKRTRPRERRVQARPGQGAALSPGGGFRRPRETHFVVLQAVDHQLREDDHAGAAHARGAVDHDGRVPALGALQHAVGVPAHRLDLLQVGCKTKGTSVTGARVALPPAEGEGQNGWGIFFLSDNDLQFLQDTNYLAGTHDTVPQPERTSWESISP